MFELVTGLLDRILGWLINLCSEERERRRDASDLARVLKTEIEEIRDEVEGRKRMWHPGGKHYSGNLEFEDDILDCFCKDYEIRRGDLGKFDDSDLVNKIRGFYNKFYKYKEVQKKGVEFYRVYEFNFGYYPGGNPLRGREKLE